MATYGARNSKWAPWGPEAQDTDPSKLPAYAAAKTFGQLNKVTDNPNFAEGSLPGDDQIVLYEQQFQDGTVEAESVYLPLADAAEMLGSAKNEKMGVAHGTDDRPPFIGYGFYTHHVGKTEHYYQVVFYPKLQAKPAGKDYATRGKDINFATDKMQFKWLAPACRKYKIEEDFATESEAQAYLDALFAGTAAVPGLAGAAAASVQSDPGSGQ